MRTAVTDVDIDLSIAGKADAEQPLNNTVGVSSSKQVVNTLAITENNLKINNEGINLKHLLEESIDELNKRV